MWEQFCTMVGGCGLVCNVGGTCGGRNGWWDAGWWARLVVRGVEGMVGGMWVGGQDWWNVGWWM